MGTVPLVLQTIEKPVTVPSPAIENPGTVP